MGSPQSVLLIRYTYSYFVGHRNFLSNTVSLPDEFGLSLGGFPASAWLLRGWVRDGMGLFFD